MKVFKVEMMIIDHDDVGEEGMVSLIENVRYPNRALSPSVSKVESREIDWEDNHPLNLTDRWKDEFCRMFDKAPWDVDLDTVHAILGWLGMRNEQRADGMLSFDFVLPEPLFVKLEEHLLDCAVHLLEQRDSEGKDRPSLLEAFLSANGRQ